MGAEHCTIVITSKKYKSTWGYFGPGYSGPGWVDKDPGNAGTDCSDAIGKGNNIDCYDKCVFDAAKSSKDTNNGGNYHLRKHNCCHWAHNILASCKLKFPFPNVNWPCNPGP